MKLYIPIQQAIKQTFKISLDQKQFEMSFYYNYSYSFFTMDLKYGDKIIFRNLALVHGIDIGSQFNPDNIYYRGRFYIDTKDGSEDSISLDTFGKVYRLVYEY